MEYCAQEISFSVGDAQTVQALYDVTDHVDFDGTCSVYYTPMSSSSNSKSCCSFASSALQSWLCSPCTIDEATPKISNSQVQFP